MSDWSGNDEEDLARSQGETRAAFENRALMYSALYEEFSDELGEERAAEVMKRAIYRRGLEIGRKYRAAAVAGDLDEVGDIFCSGSPCAGELFQPSVESSEEGRIVLRMDSCPLLDAWRAEGLDPEEVERLCDIASAVDEGTFAAAGLDLTFLDRLGRAGGGSCLLQLTIPEHRG
jgi:hypothetical protein